MSSRHANMDDLPKFDEERGELVGSMGEDYVIISAEALRRINKHEELMLGSGSFVVWYNSGKAVGKTDGEKFKRLIETMDIESFAAHLKSIYARYGWGFVQYGEVDPASGELLFTVRNSPLVRGISAKEPRCWFVRGFVEGLIGSILGAEVTAVEVACQAVNGDHCEFRLAWKPGPTGE
jgi:predicted hydrocarbon binding protein